MLGIKFKIPNKHEKYLEKILEDIGTTGDQWLISDDEVYNNTGENLFKKNTYSNQEFKSIIKNNEHYLVFANIQLYSKAKDICQIKNYYQFIHSNCMLIVFITDSEFVDIYAKEEILKIIYRNAINNRFNDVKIISNKKEIRNCFSAHSD